MPRVSTNAPASEIVLEDQNGKCFQLSDYKNKKHIILVLNRGFA